jgi:hypothetical protein
MAMDSSRVMERARQARVGAGALVRRNGPELLAYLARGASVRYQGACRDLEREVARGELRERTVYVVHPSLLPGVKGRHGIVCGRLDGYSVCVVGRDGDPFAAALVADVSKEGPSRNQSSASSG